MSVRKKPLVVVTRKLPDSIETRMRELFDARLNLDDTPLTQDQLAEAVRSADILVPTVTDHINEDVLKQADSKLKLIANFGNGVDNIDVTAAHARGITVTNTPKVLTEDTADMTMALILAVPRRLIEGASVLTDGRNWAGWSPTWMLGHRLGGKRLGIVGMGRIGQAVARRAHAFGLQIHYHNRKPVAPRIAEELGATYWESLDQMLARMDIISVNCPHTPATFHLLSARRLKLIRKDAYIVNTARGEVIDEETLTKLIEAGEIAGAASLAIGADDTRSAGSGSTASCGKADGREGRGASSRAEPRATRRLSSGRTMAFGSGFLVMRRPAGRRAPCRPRRR